MPELTLPTDSEERKKIPMLRGCLRYFPAALAGVAEISRLGNEKHNPGQEIHHARGKSSDHGDCIVRHLMDIQDILALGERCVADRAFPTTVRALELLSEANQLAWRALALSQELHEEFGHAPLAPGAKPPASLPAPVFGVDDLPSGSDFTLRAGGARNLEPCGPMRG